MKLISFGVFIFALSFCGMADRLKNLTSQSTSNSTSNATTNSNSSGSNTATSASGDKSAETPILTADQKATLDGGQVTEWQDQ